MTTTQNDRLTGPYIAVGGETVYAYDFPLFFVDNTPPFQNPDLQVERTRNGNITVLVQGVDYTVQGVGNPGGGTITLLAPATAGDIFVLYGVREYRQVNYTSNAPLGSTTMNTDSDKITQITQQLRRDIDRSIKVPIQDYGANVTYPLKDVRKNQLSGFDENGNVALYAPNDDAGSTPSTRSFIVATPGVGTPNARLLTEGQAIDINDGGAGGNITVSLDVPSLVEETVVNGQNDLVAMYDASAATHRKVRVRGLRDHVNVMDYGAVGDGIVDDSAAIQAAVNVGRSVFFPKGLYRVLTPITVSISGQVLYGETSLESYFVTAAATTNDILRISGGQVEVHHMHFRPTTANNVCIRLYGGRAYIHDNRFLAAVSGSGTAILLTDTNPVDASVIAGAYAHTIERNEIGLTAFAFALGITSSSPTNGQQANRILNNKFICNVAVTIDKGGGNVYANNLIQSSAAISGTGIDLGANVLYETIAGNYFEGLTYAVLTRRLTTDFPTVNMVDNHYDNNTNLLYPLGSVKFKHYNPEGLTDYNNTWQWNYVSQIDSTFINSLSGKTIFSSNATAGCLEPNMLGFTNSNLTFTANGQTQIPTTTWCRITGGGAARTNCLLGAGTRPGQLLILVGFTWAVQILNTNVQFSGSVASVTFGAAGGNIASMILTWDGGTKWYELGRSTV